MKPSIFLVLILVLVLTVSAVLTPFVQAVVEFLIAIFPVLKEVSKFSFDRVMSRVMLITALAFIWAFRKRLYMPGIWRVLFPKNGKGRKEFWLGAASGVLTLIILIGITLYTGARRLDISSLIAGKFIFTAAKAVMTALVVALIEEIFFRGFILQAFLKDLKKIWAVTITSFFFSIVHFTQIAGHPSFAKFDLLAGFKTLGLMFAPLGDLSAVIPGFIGLFIVGFILAYCCIWTRGLYFSIGLHAGWIFIIKTDSLFVLLNQGQKYSFYGTEKMVDGMLSWIILLGLLCILKVVLGQKNISYKP